MITVEGSLDYEQLVEEDEEVQLQVTVSGAALLPSHLCPLPTRSLNTLLRPLSLGLCSALQATESNLNIHGQEAKVSLWVTIRVLDVNDHTPEFYNCSLPDCSFTPQEAQASFTGYVDEHASARIPVSGLTMVAYDPDKAGAWAGARAGHDGGDGWEAGAEGVTENVAGGGVADPGESWPWHCGGCG